jgi:hypothetical protein
MGEKDAVKMNPSAATIWWYQRLEEWHNFKNAENQGGNSNSKCTVYTGIINFIILL